MEGRFRDRAEAGRLLAEELKEFAGQKDVIVLALPRGGVPVASEVATALDAPLDVFTVRKLGVPEQPELAMGAIASGGVRVLNEDLLGYLSLSAEAIEEVAAREEEELSRRERAYRGDRPFPEIRGRKVILVDDGIATGTSIRSAIEALRKQRPERIVVAVPVAPQIACDQLNAMGDDVECICLMNPEQFIAVGLWYEDFVQTTDQEVCSLLEQSMMESRAKKQEAL
jgi:predicted phosphoribosyltransferase